MICKRYVLAIGMNDAVSLKQEHTREEVIKIVSESCKKYDCPFSFTLAKGGYLSGDGGFVEEFSIIVSIINPENPEVVDKIAKDLCKKLNQQFIAITIDEVERRLVRAD